MTRWLSIPGYKGEYEVSDDGQVRALPGAVRVEPGVKKLNKPKKGYWQVRLYSGDGKRGSSNHRVHVLMLEAFVGPRPPGMHALHADDDRDNNTLPNLRWGTQSQNQLDKVRNGNHHYARRTHCKWGHPLEGDNLKPRRRGARDCRACDARRSAEYRARLP